MAEPPSGLHMERIKEDRAQITAAASTICAAFFQDPLIRWLRPTQTLSAPSLEAQRWEYRRLQWATIDGFVFSSSAAARTPAPAATSLEETAEKKNTSLKDPICSSTEAAVILFPPKRIVEHSLWRYWRKLKMSLVDYLDPVIDGAASFQRVDQLMAAHNAALDGVKARVGDVDLWYLEVIAVHPSLQGQGVGKKVMQEVLRLAGSDPVVLECTASSNVPFYRKFGFEVVEEIVLHDTCSTKADECRIWVMLRST